MDLANIRIKKNQDDNNFIIYGIPPNYIKSNFIQWSPRQIARGRNNVNNLGELKYSILKLSNKANENNLIGKLLNPVLYLDLENAPIPKCVNDDSEFVRSLYWFKNTFLADKHNYLKIGIDNLNSLEVVMSFLSFDEIGDIKLEIRELCGSTEFYLPILKKQSSDLLNLLNSGDVYAYVHNLNK